LWSPPALVIYPEAVVSNDEKPIMLFETVERWESWLSENFDHVGVRLQIRRRASNAPGITADEALDSALCYGWIDGQAKGLDADYFLQVYTPRRPRSVWSQRNVEIITRLTDEGRMRAFGIEQVQRARPTVAGRRPIGRRARRFPTTCRRRSTHPRRPRRPSPR